MKDRIRQIMESQHMTQQSFAQFLGMSPASLSSIFNGRTNPTLNTVESIKSKIPNISTNWLIFGTGEMYDSQSQPSTDKMPSPQFANETVLDFDSDDIQPASNVVSPTPVPHTVDKPQQEIIRHEIKYIDKPQRKITEIRVYFDDLTYETFEPKK